MSKTKKIIIDFIFMTLGSLLYAIGLSLFLDPYDLAPGGVGGLGIIISYWTNIKSGTIIYLINIPILIFGFFKFGWKTMASTIYVTTISSFMMNGIESLFIPRFGLITQDYIIAAIAGGALLGSGMAIVFHHGGTTGGSDIIVKAIRQKVPQLKTGKIFLISDSCIVALSAIAFKNIQTGLYAAVAIVVTNAVLDLLLYKNDGANLLYIITEEPETIAERIMKEVDIGVTYLHGEGAYTGASKKVLMVVAKPAAYAKIRFIVREVDKNAFFIVSGASDVFGYGYKDHFMQEM